MCEMTTGVAHPRPKLSVLCKGSWWLIGSAISNMCWGSPMVALLGCHMINFWFGGDGGDEQGGALRP